MTICISVKIAEGLVLAADSAVVASGTVQTPEGPQQGVVQTFSYANKVGRIKDYPVGFMTWGASSIGDRSINSLVMEWEYGYPSMDDSDHFAVKDIATSLSDFVKQRYESEHGEDSNKSGIGFFVGGYSAQEFFPEIYVCAIPSDPELIDLRPDIDNRPSFGANWFGQVAPLARLIKGCTNEGAKELRDLGVEEGIIKEWAKNQEHPLIFEGMPIQDAIDFAKYAAFVAAGYYRFGVGPPVCGGDIDIAVITPTDFKWADRKDWGIKD